MVAEQNAPRAMAHVPSSHGSLHEDERREDEEEELLGGEGRRPRHGPDSDQFDSDEYREFLRFRRETQSGSRARRRGSQERDSDEERPSSSKGGSTQPPDWDGISMPFQDWLIKARLWLATCRARPQSQGPLLLQKLSGAPFQAFKHWAKDPEWLASKDGGNELLAAMNQPEYFGDDKEEDMIGSLAKLTYHLKRHREEKHREFFNRWDEALRKTKEHGIELPDRYLGFLMINSLGLDEATIKNLLSYTRGSIATKDVKEWTRKFETKLLAKDMGQETKRSVTQGAMQKGTQSVYHLNAEYQDYHADDEDDIYQVEAALEELHETDNPENYEEEDTNELILDEHEAAEVLNTMLQQKRKTFSESWKLKKAKEVARGYGDWKGKGSNSQPKGKGKKKGVSVEELKAMTRCKNCNRVGHWHRECPEPKREKPGKELHYLEEQDDFPEASFCGYLETETSDLQDKEYQLDYKMKSHDHDEQERTSERDRLEGNDQLGLSTDQHIEYQETVIVEEKDYLVDQPQNQEKDNKLWLQQHETTEETANTPGPSTTESAVMQAANFDRLEKELKPIFSESESARAYIETTYPSFGHPEIPEHEVMWSETSRPSRNWRDPAPAIDEDCCATIDTGCQRMAIGQTTLDLLSQALPQDITVGTIPQKHKFRTVNGKSETTHIATIPTSLGHKGSTLRPAIFSHPESSKAPFLISLPFLLYCRTVLHLDPSDGLRVYFRRFKFSVRCHIGPTGALRIPLNHFTSEQIQTLQGEQRKYQQEQQEFEVYKIGCTLDLKATGLKDSSSGNSSSDQDGATPQASSTDDHQRAGADSIMAEDRREAAVHRGPRDGVLSGATQDAAATECHKSIPIPGGPLQCLRTKGQDEWNDLRDRRIGRQLERGGRQRDRDDRPPARTNRPPRSRSPKASGISTKVPPSTSSQALGSPETRPQLPSSVLDLPGGDREAVRILHVGTLPTVVEDRESSREPPYKDDTDELSDTARDIYQEPNTEIDAKSAGRGELHADGMGDTELGADGRQLPSHSNHNGGFQQPREESEVQGLRHADQRGVDQSEVSEQERQPGDEQGSVHNHALAQRRLEQQDEPANEFENNGEHYGGRVRGLQALETEAGEVDPNERGWNRQAEIQYRQAVAALERAESSLQEIMSLLTEPDPHHAGWSRIQQTMSEAQCTQPLKKYGEILQIDVKSLKKVSELYNPNRFGESAKKIGLLKGTAFDLQLGTDLLDPLQRERVRDYFKDSKPGLTIISPPCTMFSRLQQLRKTKHEDWNSMQVYLRRLQEAKRLLRFGVEIALQICQDGGAFVFEHPLTSMAWGEREVQRLISLEQVILVKGDQCMYGLQDINGKFYRKPTGWLTNVKEIATQLNQRCDHSHEHEHVLGSNSAGSRSLQAQHYPADIVQGILRGYKNYIGDKFKVEHVRYQDIRRQLNSESRTEQLLLQEDNDYKTAQHIHAVDLENSAPEEPDADEETEETGQPEDMPDIDRTLRRLPRERPLSMEHLVRRAHEGLGHPGNDRLARILKSAGARPDAIKFAKELKCAVCEQHQKTRPPRQAAPPKELQVNSVVGIDTVYLPTWSGRTRPALNIVCWATRFQLVVPISGPNPLAARRAYLQWVKFFGPPTKLYVDLGREFGHPFNLGAEMDATIVEPASLEMPTQRSITERAGKNFKEVFEKALTHHAVQNEEDWMQLVDITTMTVNRLTNKSGFSPIQRVLGYTPRIPGGLLTGGFNDLSTASRYHLGDMSMQKSIQMRLAAEKAFHEADCSQALRHAVHAGRRPVLEYEVGQVVYFWRKATERVKKNAARFWRGPARVVLTSLPSSVWITYRGTIVKAAPEQLRRASEEEMFALSSWMTGLSETRAELEQNPRRGYLDITNEESPPAEDPGPQDLKTETVLPKYPLRKKSRPDQVTERDQLADYWEIDDEYRLLRRVHLRARGNLFFPTDDASSCPVPTHTLEARRRTRVQDLQTGRVTLVEDDWTDLDNDGVAVNQGRPWKGWTEFEITSDQSLPEGGPVAAAGPSIELEPRSEDTPIPNNDYEPAPPPSTTEMPTADGSEHPEAEKPTPMDLEESDSDLETRPPRTATRRLEQDSDEDEASPLKRTRLEYLDLMNVTLEKIMAQKQKKEIRLRDLLGERRERFLVAIRLEIQNNLNTGAYEFIDLKTSEHLRATEADKILQSRYVLVEKSIEADDVEGAREKGVLINDDGDSSTKAKARHVMKGFSEWNAEAIDATTPQVTKESFMLILQIICSSRWTPGYLDFTQAFHSGDEINRVLYAEVPPEGVPGFGIHDRQLLKLKKHCYGLLDGPYAWYLHLGKLLSTMGYQQSIGDPCVYYLFDKNKVLEGIVGIATDDLLHGGSPRHWALMESIKGKYKLGKFATGNGRFTGKEITVLPGGNIKVTQSLYVKEKIAEIPINKQRKGERLSSCTTSEIGQLRTLLGALSWLAKESRPDLSGRTAILQQSMPHPCVQDMIEANQLAKEAKLEPDLGVTLYPIPLQHLRIGSISDASWGNVKDGEMENDSQGDFWTETEDRWIRHHRQPRRILFHPGATGFGAGPDLHRLLPDRMTYMDGVGDVKDLWNIKLPFKHGSLEPWVGRTEFFKTDERGGKVVETYLQQARTSSQAGYMVVAYDARMETEARSFQVSLLHWKSTKLKRQTVNTLSAETQAMILGVGNLHWQRFMLLEARGVSVGLHGWEEHLAQIPFLAITDSKSLYDCAHKCCSPAAQVEDKRTAIDVTILKNDFRRGKGQIRWVPGHVMIADSLTKKMSAQGLKNFLKSGKWSLFEHPDSSQP